MLGAADMGIIPPKDQGEWKSTGMRFPTSVLEELDRLAYETGYSRNEVVIFLVKWGIQQYDKEKAGGGAAAELKKKK